MAVKLKDETMGRSSYYASAAQLVLTTIFDAKQSSQPAVFIKLMLDEYRRTLADQPEFCRLVCVALMEKAEAEGLLGDSSLESRQQE